MWKHSDRSLDKLTLSGQRALEKDESVIPASQETEAGLQSQGLPLLQSEFNANLSNLVRLS